MVTALSSNTYTQSPQRVDQNGGAEPALSEVERVFRPALNSQQFQGPFRPRGRWRLFAAVFLHLTVSRCPLFPQCPSVVSFLIFLELNSRVFAMFAFIRG